MKIARQRFDDLEAKLERLRQRTEEATGYPIPETKAGRPDDGEARLLAMVQQHTLIEQAVSRWEDRNRGVEGLIRKDLSDLTPAGAATVYATAEDDDGTDEETRTPTPREWANGAR